jgi:4-oxalocrotonate tautomerase
MPVITIEGPVLSLEMKERIAREFAQLASDITTIPKEAFVIFVKENPYENMSQGGVLISEKLKK